MGLLDFLTKKNEDSSFVLTDLNSCLTKLKIIRSQLEMCASGMPVEHPSTDVVGSTTACELGKWIKAEGKKHHGDDPHFALLVRAHETFHSKAADLSKRLDAGDKASAKELLPEFREVSDNLVSLVEKFIK